MMKHDAIQDVPQDDEPIAGPVWTYVLAGIAGTGLAGAIFGVSAGYWFTCGPSPCNRFYGADLIRVLSWVPMWGIVFGLVWGIAPSLWLARRFRKSRPVAGLRAWFMAVLMLVGYLAVDRTTIYVESPVVKAVYFGLLGGALGFLLGQVPAIGAGGVERFHPSWHWLRWPLSLAAFVATFQILVADFSDRVRSFAGLWEEQNTRLQLMILVGGSVVYVSTTLVLNRWLHPAASEIGVKEPH